MNIKEYNEELQMVKDNYKVCKENEKVLKQERELIDELLQLKPMNSELIRLKVKANFRYYTNDDMLRVLNCALRILKDDKDTSSLYNAYVALYADLAKRYVEESESEEFLYLANKYIPNTEMENKA